MANKQFFKNAIFGAPAVPPSANRIKSTQNVSEISKFSSAKVGVQPARAHLWATTYMLFHKERHFGIGYCDSRKELIVEMKAVKSQTRKVMIYNTNTKSLSVAVLDANGDIVPNSHIAVVYMATTQLIHLIISDSDIEHKWRDTQETFVQNGSQCVYEGSSIEYILDALYYSIGTVFPNIDMDTEIGVIDDSTPRDDFRDITEDVIGVPGEFQFAKVIRKQSNKNASNANTVITLDTLRSKYSHLTEDYFNSLPPEHINLIPKLDDRLADYIVKEDFLDTVELLAAAIEENNMRGKSVFSVGPPSLGKSLNAYAIAYIFRIPLRYMQGHKDVTAAEIIGAPVAENGVLDTKTNTAVLDCMRYGGLMLMDDYSYIHTGYSTIMLSMLETPFSVVSATSELINRHPLCLFYFTANPDSSGSHELNDALWSRGFIVEEKTIEDMLPEEIIKMVETASKYPSHKEVEIMYACFEAICKDIKQNPAMATANPCTVRNLIAWATQARILKNPVRASLKNLIPSLRVSKEQQRRIFTTIIVPRFPPKYAK